jgi:hypothetical protein
MKQAVSVSLGTATRDSQAIMTLLGERVSLGREGMDGDVERAAARFADLDGRVDALGLGGINFAIHVGERSYPLRSASNLIRDVRKTPVVDGSGLKSTLERRVVEVMVGELGSAYQSGRVLLVAATDRPGMTEAFFEAGYDVVCGDLMFGLGLPVPVRTYRQLAWLARIAAPMLTRLPITMLYPTGEKQERIVPRFGRWYAWADVIAGDCLFIKRHMPADLHGKVVVTNTTTEDDMALFRERDVTAVVTTTPVVEGRSFGTNLLEAALTAASGKGRPLRRDELSDALAQLKLKPSVHHL